MLTLNITRNAIVKKLIKIRCKYAMNEAEALKTNDYISYKNSGNKQKSLQNAKRNNDKHIIYKMFPRRKDWCHLGTKRLNMDSTRRNETKLYYTYLKARKENSKAEWYIELCKYSDDIIKMIENPGNSIPTPKVFVIEKERNEKEIICRPICTFPLNLRIALSIINKILTKLFDSYFLDCSYAFRTSSKRRGQFQHINAVKDIKAYRENHLSSHLFVAECDMKKFYDTINHNIIKKRFINLLSKTKKENKISRVDYKILKRWFYNYIDCFDFKHDVYKYNRTKNDNNIWESIKNKDNLKCKIGWVKELNNKSKSKNGVPQGGALSGLIANIVMHYIDKNVVKQIKDKDIKYFRFCDDMILIGSNKIEVNDIFNNYIEYVKNSKLFSHENKVMRLKKMSEFWEGKTRGPYEWGEKGNDVYPWITFVGFDCNWKGNLRIRKRSLDKEIKKQYTVTEDIIKRYRNPNIRPKYELSIIKHNLISKLIGMSVGRIDLTNFRNNNNIHSWMSVFSILDKNKWSESQMKRLDRHRRHIIHRISKKLLKYDYSTVKKKTTKERGFIKYKGKPFSYYGQCFDYKE